MLSYATLGSNDRQAARRFYDATLAPLGLKRTYADDEFCGYGPDAMTIQRDQVAKFDGVKGLELVLDGLEARLAEAVPAAGGAGLPDSR